MKKTPAPTRPNTPFPPVSGVLRRRLSFAYAWRYRLDQVLNRLGLGAYGGAKWIYVGGTVAFDALCSLLALRWQPHAGRAYLAALEDDVFVEQEPRYRSYWHDAGRNALVGLHLGIDLNHFDGRYYLIENNLGPGMPPSRRAVYPQPVDPVLTGLVSFAEKRKFKQIHIYSTFISEELRREVKLVEQDFDGSVHLHYTIQSRERPKGVQAAIELPDPLPRDSLHVLFNHVCMTPLMHHIHDKELVQTWFSRMLQTRDTRLAPIRSQSDLFVPQPREGIWPNLVIKLTEADAGQAVEMGLFDNEAHARRVLGMSDARNSRPDLFAPAKGAFFFRRLPQSKRFSYQEYVPSDVVDGRLRTIRLHALVSPLEDVMLSAHGVIAGLALPDRLEKGLLSETTRDAFILKRKKALRLERLGQDIDKELKEVTRDFGAMLRQAVSIRFDTGLQDLHSHPTARDIY